MKHYCVEDPSDLCSVNISSKNLSDVKEDDFSLFDNVPISMLHTTFYPLVSMDLSDSAGIKFKGSL